MKMRLIITYSLAFFIYALLILPSCMLVYETASFSFYKLSAMFGIPLLAGIVLAYPFNQWAQKLHQSSNVFLFNAPFLTPLIFFWAFVVWGSIEHYNRYPVLILQKNPQLVDSPQSLDPHTYGFVEFQHIATQPALQNVYTYNIPSYNKGSERTNQSSKVRHIAVPISFENIPDRPIQYWFAGRFDALGTANYSVSENQKFSATAYFIRIDKDIENYKKAIEAGLKINNIEVADTTHFLDYIPNFEAYTASIEKRFFLYYALYFILMILIWFGFLKYIKRGIGA